MFEFDRRVSRPYVFSYFKLLPRKASETGVPLSSEVQGWFNEREEGDRPEEVPETKEEEKDEKQSKKKKIKKKQKKTKKQKKLNEMQRIFGRYKLNDFYPGMKYNRRPTNVHHLSGKESEEC